MRPWDIRAIRLARGVVARQRGNSDHPMRASDPVKADSDGNAVAGVPDARKSPVPAARRVIPVAACTPTDPIEATDVVHPYPTRYGVRPALTLPPLPRW